MKHMANLSRADRRTLILEIERENRQHPEALADLGAADPRVKCGLRPCDL